MKKIEYGFLAVFLSINSSNFYVWDALRYPPAFVAFAFFLCGAFLYYMGRRQGVFEGKASTE